MVADLPATRDVVADLSARRLTDCVLTTNTDYEPQITLRIVGSKYAMATREMSVRMI